jgi:type I restriction enzyme S subunit
LPIPVPPITLQNQFAQQIQNIEQQKEKLKLQMQESENLFKALLQKAFNGGLNNFNSLVFT